MATLTIEDLVVGYGRNEVIHGVSLEVPAGSRVGLLGANGAGKSTILKTVSGLLRPRRGAVRLDGVDMAGKRPADIVRQGVVQVPEGRHIFAEMSIRENLRLGGYGRDRRHVEAGVERALEAFPRLKERLGVSAGLLSGGEQQMLALGRAIVAQPKVLLLDEMSLGLAPLLVKEFYARLGEVFDPDLTMLVVEQNAKLAIKVVDTLYVLRNGTVAAHGEASTFAEDEDLLHRSYLGVG